MKKVQWLLAGAGDIVKSRVAAALSAAENSEIAGTTQFQVGLGNTETIVGLAHDVDTLAGVLG